ncbi:MAG: chorismate mutase [Candidatus Paceibacterota bacterium]
MNIKEIREKIDLIDEDILGLIKQRFVLLDEVVKYKIDNNLPIQDSKREKEILKNKTDQALVLGLNSDFVKVLFKNIMKQSREIQKGIFKQIKKSGKK